MGGCRAEHLSVLGSPLPGTECQETAGHCGVQVKSSGISCLREPLPLEQVLPEWVYLILKVVCNTYFVFVTALCVIFQIIQPKASTSSWNIVSESISF